MEVVQPSIISIKIEYVNEILTSSVLSGLILKENKGLGRISIDDLSKCSKIDKKILILWNDRKIFN